MEGNVASCAEVVIYEARMNGSNPWLEGPTFEYAENIIVDKLGGMLGSVPAKSSVYPVRVHSPVLHWNWNK